MACGAGRVTAMNLDRARWSRLRRQLDRAAELPFYRHAWSGTGTRQGDSPAGFTQLPLVSRSDLVADVFDVAPPYGSFYRSDVCRVNLTPSPRGLMPVYYTRADIEAMDQVNATLLRSAGVNPADRAMVLLSYHVFPAGLVIGGGLEALGCAVFPHGPGETERAIDLCRRFRINVIYGNPSFALRLAECGVTGIDVLIAGGEPLSSVPGRREALTRAFGGTISVVESYGMAECLPIARECSLGNGLHVADEHVHVEIVDPETGGTLPEGEPGEIVVTHLAKQAMPLVRYRTGDIGALRVAACPCGRTYSFDGGILGRTDTMRKIKGVKVYPQQLTQALARVPGLEHRRVKLVVEGADGADRLTLCVSGDRPATLAVDDLRARVSRELVISPNEIVFGDEYFTTSPDVIDDRRPRRGQE